jgi:hypothetical protein
MLPRTAADVSDPGWRRLEVLLKLAGDQRVADYAS